MNPVPGFDFTVMFMPQFVTAQAPNTAVEDVGSRSDSLQNASNQSSPAPLILGFAEVSGLNSEMEVEEYREGGLNFAPRKFVKWGRFPSLVCRRGVTASTDLWDWYRRVQIGTTTSIERRNGFVIIHAHGTSAGSTIPNGGGQPIAAWFFQNALPERLQGPSLNARSNEIAIETLELSHEGMLRVRLTQIPGLNTSGLDVVGD